MPYIFQRNLKFTVKTKVNILLFFTKQHHKNNLFGFNVKTTSQKRMALYVRPPIFFMIFFLILKVKCIKIINAFVEIYCTLTDQVHVPCNEGRTLSNNFNFCKYGRLFGPLYDHLLFMQKLSYRFENV